MVKLYENKIIRRIILKYLQVTVSTLSEASELVAMIMYDNGSEGVSINDDADVRELIEKKISWDYVDEKLLECCSNKALVSGFFSTDCNVSAIYEDLRALKERAVIEVGSLEAVTSVIDSADWENEWRKYYKPLYFGDVVIVPAWQRPPLDAKVPVFIEPGMAFGTGNHETTSMCISFMQFVDMRGKSVLDMGCGSGILGISAAKLGARHVILSDIDEQALIASRANAALNGVSEVCAFLGGDLNSGGVTVDVVVANITADVLLRLCDLLRDVLKKGGDIIISGIINARASEIEHAYAADFELVNKRVIGEWQAMLLKKK